MPEPSRQTQDTWAHLRTAWCELVRNARSTLMLGEADLLALELDTVHVHEALRHSLPRLRPGGMRIVLVDARPLLNHLPRTRALLTDYAHIASVRVAAERDLPAMAQAMLIADARHVLIRPRHDRARAILESDAPLRARALSAHLETIWGAASNANIGAVLGL